MLDAGDAVLMVLLDLSAAFDTIDHSLLLKRMEQDVGLCGSALSWLASYLSDRKQSVCINDCISKPSNLSVGVPQGSVLGPVLFLCYILPLKDLIEQFGLHRHGYADDTQLYCKLSLKDTTLLSQQLSKVEACLQEIRLWMCTNQLKLNDAKTEMLIISAQRDSECAAKVTIQMGEDIVHPKKAVRNLGAVFDCHLNMARQISQTTCNAYYHLRRIAKIRHHLDDSACARAIHSTVTSRLDYHNGLLLGLPKTHLQKLQVAQNSAARLLTNTKKRTHITPVLAQLHWLPIECRIKYKTLSLIHKGLHSEYAPTYLQEICKQYIPRRTLRSSEDPWKLTVTRPNHSFGARSILHDGARLWNSLPLFLRLPQSFQTFKKHLKTHLFSNFYN